MQKGYLIALSREDAKLVFSAKGDEALSTAVDQLLHSEPIRQSGYQLDCGTSWQRSHDTLAAIVGDDPLDQVLLGGRPLYHGDDRSVCLVRPDLVRPLAAALGNLNANALGEAAESIAQIRSIYEVAARDGCAMLFCTK